MISRRVNHLREVVAYASGQRPSWVGLMFVRHIWGNRIDVRFEWVGSNPGLCLVHTTSRTSVRRAIREVLDVADFIRPGVRFEAAHPQHTSEYP